ncbi:MAG: NUDIX hydrolase [Streptosporangiaceae bacterium]
MTPAAVTDALLHDLAAFARAEGLVRLAVAAAVTLEDRVLFCGRTTRDFDQEWELPGGMALPGETLADAHTRILACDYGLSIVDIPGYLGSYDQLHAGETIRTFAFTATCADPQQICQQAQTAHCWAGPASLPAQVSPDLARLADIAVAQTAITAEPGPWQLTAALRAGSQGMYCDQAATELIISHRTWLSRTDFTGQYIATQPRLAGGTSAVIDWDEAIAALRGGDLPCSGSEAAILLLAASLATASLVNLRDAVTGLDQANLQLVISAVRHAGGRN